MVTNQIIIVLCIGPDQSNFSSPLKSIFPFRFFQTVKNDKDRYQNFDMVLYVPAIKNIWLADDDPDDCELFHDVIKQLLPATEVTIIPNGETLLNTLSTSNKPDMLFLDINMPRKDGLDSLLEIRAQRHFWKLPIVVFSSSKATHFIDASYGYGANLYYTKPSTFQDLIEGLGSLLQMNWDDPFSITGQHYINKRFTAYRASF
jgi:CheY-like chemotaxis protein